MAEAKTPPDSGNSPGPQPGSVITPSAAVQEPVKAAPAAAKPATPPVPAPAAPTPLPTAETPSPTPVAGPDPVKEDLGLPSPDSPLTEGGPELPDADNPQRITWSASEFIAHDKSPGWYMGLAGGTIVVAILVFIITRDKISVSVVVITGILLGVYARHQPRQVQYSITPQGVGIGGKYYGYDGFRSFSVVPEGAFTSIVFMPLKRFGVPVTIYYAPDDEDKILALLSDQLPFEEHHSDAVDNLMRRIRF